MRIAVAQLDPIVGSFESNVKKIKEAYKQAVSKGARLLMTPELGICGYPPHDLADRPEMIERNERAIQDLMAETKPGTCALAVGHIDVNPGEEGRSIQNSVTILEKGRRVFRQAKTLLPTYDVFDEARYFEPAKSSQIWKCDDHKVAVAICEDLWADDPTLGRRLYQNSPVEQYRSAKADIVLSISASPYEWGKRKRREALHAEVARNLGAPLVYVNQVGATDEVLFDGGSFACDQKGNFLGRLPVFKTSFGIIDLAKGAWESGTEDDPTEIETLTRALVTGIRDYFQRTGFKTAVIGLSGGIDSAVVATLAAQALGPQNVLGVAMPSQFSSSHSLEDAEALARNLGIRYEVKPIKFMFATVNRELSENRGGPLAAVAQENLQSRLRGLILMTLSNHYNALVLTTGNKSEIATGYCTLYGDMVGALAPIGDVLKTKVYDLARYMNQIWGHPIPENSITKAPSAELRPDQKDQDSLPPYEELDALLVDYIERHVSLPELLERHGKDSTWVKETIRRVEINEFKRRQAAPVLKVSNKAFGIGRRIPIAKTWNQ